MGPLPQMSDKGKYFTVKSLFYGFIPLLILTFIVYYPGIHGGFIYDDFPNIVNNPGLAIHSLNIEDLLDSSLSIVSGPLKRPVSALSFALNYYFAGGFNPYYFKLVNIVIHLINGLLAGLLAYLVIELASRIKPCDEKNIRIIALSVAAVWILHPVNLTSILYVVQRMNSLAALFTFAGVSLYILGRNRIRDGKGGKPYLFLAFFICGPLAILSKENGSLMYLYVLLVEFLFYSRESLGRIDKRIIYTLFGIFVLVPAVFVFLYIGFHPEYILDGYRQRTFDLTERLFTEARVIWFYVYLILLPNLQQMSLHHDSIMISRGLFDPVTTIISIIGIFLFVWFSFACRKKYPLVSFGILFFLVGHCIESTVLPLVIAFEHRNYVPSFGLILVICSLILDNSISPGTLLLRRLMIVILIGMLAFSTNIRAKQWGNTNLLRFYELIHNPDSAMVNYEVGRFYASVLESDEYIHNRDEIYDKAEHYFKRVLEIRPNNIEALVGLLILKISNRNQVDYNLFSELDSILAKKQIDSTGIAAIKALLNCKKNLDCDFPDTAIESMIDSIGKNDHLYGRYGELMFSNISKYYLGTDSEKALNMALKALSMNPDSVEMRFYLSGLMIGLGKYNEAHSLIQSIEQRDRFDIYGDRIEHLKEALSDAQK